MSIVALLALIFGLKLIAQDGPGPMPIGAIAVGLAVGALWVRRQRGLDDPMIDVSLFRIRAFNAALGVNFLSIFVMVGYFLFVAQYLQLVVGLSPLEAGLWSLPSAIAFIAGSQLTPRFLAGVAPSWVIGGGLAVAAAGLAMLTQVETDGLPLLITASVVTSLGMAPVFGLTTELVVGSAPPERAGAASGISETASELGGALGIAVLGSIGVAVYRAEVASGLPAGVPTASASAARDTLGGAVAAAADLPAALGGTVVAVAQRAFVDGMHVTSALSAIVAFGLAAVAFMALRPRQESPATDSMPPEQVAHVAPCRLEGAD